MVGMLRRSKKNAGRAEQSSRGELRPTEFLPNGSSMSRIAVVRSALVAVIAAMTLGARLGCAPANRERSHWQTLCCRAGLHRQEREISPVIPLSGIGDKAAYTVSALTGNVPQLKAVHADLDCGIQMNASGANW